MCVCDTSNHSQQYLPLAKSPHPPLDHHEVLRRCTGPDCLVMPVRIRARATLHRPVRRARMLSTQRRSQPAAWWSDMGCAGAAPTATKAAEIRSARCCPCRSAFAEYLCGIMRTVHYLALIQQVWWWSGDSLSDVCVNKHTNTNISDKAPCETCN